MSGLTLASEGSDGTVGQASMGFQAYHTLQYLIRKRFKEEKKNQKNPSSAHHPVLEGLFPEVEVQITFKDLVPLSHRHLRNPIAGDRKLQLHLGNS